MSLFSSPPFTLTFFRLWASPSMEKLFPGLTKTGSSCPFGIITANTPSCTHSPSYVNLPPATVIVSTSTIAPSGLYTRNSPWFMFSRCPSSFICLPSGPQETRTRVSSINRFLTIKKKRKCCAASFFLAGNTTLYDYFLK